MARRILVTGAAGFIGSTYANMAVARYPEDYFILLDALTPIADLNNLLPETREAVNARFVKADIRDNDSLNKLFKEEQITDIINFAAETHVDVSIRSPQDFIETNIVGTHNLLRLAHASGINRFHHISTDEVYGALGSNDPSFTEASSLAPNNPYSASKAAADCLVRSYHKTFGLNTVITRSSNNFGPRQDPSKVIPLFVTRLLSGGNVPLYADGSNVRDWLFVEDNAEGIDTVFRKGVSGEVYNIGGNYECSNLELTRKLLALTGRDESAITYVPDRLGHDFRYSLSNEKITGMATDYLL